MAEGIVVNERESLLSVIQYQHVRHYQRTCSLFGVGAGLCVCKVHFILFSKRSRLALHRILFMKLKGTLFEENESKGAYVDSYLALNALVNVCGSHSWSQNLKIIQERRITPSKFSQDESLNTLARESVQFFKPRLCS